MAAYLSTKMKRKDLDEVNDDFSDFSLSSPARKIRRLDADLPPIMEEDEPRVPLVVEEQVKGQVPGNMGRVGVPGPRIEELPMVPENEERAIVLFKPMSTPLFQSPSSFSVTVNSDVISGFKIYVHHADQILWSSQANTTKSADDEASKEGYASRNNGCLAVVPWVPTHISSTPPPQTETPELMDSEEMGAVSMDVEENNFTADPELGAGLNEGLHHWQQQHCMMPEIPQHVSTPITWFQ
ncbi:hypothetical protein NMG60_11023826 [Bertholletia excelsa]